MKLSKGKKVAVAAVGVFVLLGATASTVYAVSNTDTGDHFSLAAGTVVTGNLKSGTSFVAKGTIDAVPITVTCTTFTTSGKIPATGLKIKIAPPTISGCTDTSGGADTVVTNQTNGKWSLTEVDAVTGDTTEPNTGDKVKLKIPMAGATFQSSVLSGCVVTVAPTAAASVTGTYDDHNTLTFTNVAFPTSGTGCSTSASSTSTATEVLNNTVHDT